MNTHKLRCAEWDAIQMGDLDETSLFRHLLFLGETGSGKTTSGIKPLCRLAFAADRCFNGKQAAGLVVDPKAELGAYLEELVGAAGADRLLRLKPGGPGPVLWQFEHQQLDEIGAIGVVEQMMASSDAFNGQQEVLNDRFWFDAAKQFLQAIVEIDLTLWRHPNGLGVENIRQFWSCLSGLLQLLSVKQPEAPALSNAVGVERIVSGDKYDQPLRVASFFIYRNCGDEAQQLVARNLQSGQILPLVTYQPENYLNHIVDLLTLATSGVWSGEVAKAVLRGLKAGELSHTFNVFWALFMAFVAGWKINDKAVFSQGEGSFFSQYMHMADTTYASIYAVISNLINDQASPEFCSRISINPFEPPEVLLSTSEVIQEGRIVVYEPDKTSTVALTIGKTLKAGFFKALLVPERMNNHTVRPFFYICDEFQRFITHDEDSGEQSFLDRCRAYRVCCGLATQSIASLRYSLPSKAGEHAIDIILINTGTKLFFRTTDNATANSLSGLIPAPPQPDKLHVVRVRPLSTLKPGECYYLLVNGKAGRGQIGV
ncbi:TraM recognition domain-containing protein [Trichlorobacter sp.]|uniref:TraM recognition domain-containing protein n=1 Tax=Trichlorobacter sp. TaxID=2911007 RepID=UPI002A37028E|nr:TraM recognition domain-containing protein [Trichlorobacter sp.]MDY0383603.1 TraM recognition domain-containing protein [Trichlorobacter sp.]